MSDGLWVALAGAGGTLLGAVARGLAQTRVASAVSHAREATAAAETDRALAPQLLEDLRAARAEIRALDEARRRDRERCLADSEELRAKILDLQTLVAQRDAQIESIAIDLQAAHRELLDETAELREMRVALREARDELAMRGAD